MMYMITHVSALFLLSILSTPALAQPPPGEDPSHNGLAVAGVIVGVTLGVLLFTTLCLTTLSALNNIRKQRQGLRRIFSYPASASGDVENTVVDDCECEHHEQVRALHAVPYESPPPSVSAEDELLRAEPLLEMPSEPPPAYKPMDTYPTQATGGALQSAEAGDVVSHVGQGCVPRIT